MNEKIVDSIKTLVHERKFDSAIKMADAYLHSLPDTDAGNGSINYAFEDLEEFLFCVALEKEESEAANITGRNLTWVNTQASTVSRMQAYALIELGRHNEAISVLKQALEKSNPIGIALRFEMVEAYLASNQLHQAEKELATLSTMVISRQDIARYYRRLGYCMIERKEYADAKICLLYSFCFEMSDSALGELAYIDDLLGTPWGSDARAKVDSITSASSLRSYAEKARERNRAFTPTETQKNCVLLLVSAYAKAGKMKEKQKWMNTYKLWAESTNDEIGVVKYSNVESGVLH